MKQTVWQRLDLLARNLTPFGLSVMLVLIGIAPLHVPDLARVAPVLPLVAVYHWTVHRPELMPAAAVFALGLFQDLVGGGPVGLQTLVLLVVYGVVLGQRRFLYGKSFAVVWLGFLLVAAGAQVLSWGLACVYQMGLLPPRPFGFQYVLTVSVYPPVSWLLLRWQQLVLRQE